MMLQFHEIFNTYIYLKKDFVNELFVYIFFFTGCVDKIELPFRIIFWAIPSLMAFVLMSALIVCSRTKTTSSGRSVRNKRR